MESILLILGWVGLFSPIALGAIGSIIGCSRGGLAACGAMLEVESGHGRLVGVSALPSSQTIYGIAVMVMLSRYPVAVETAPALVGIGVLSGVALMMSAIMQGVCCAASINVGKSKPESLGLSIAPAAMVEGFAVFVLVFALMAMQNIPTTT